MMSDGIFMGKINCSDRFHFCGSTAILNSEFALHRARFRVDWRCSCEIQLPTAGLSNVPKPTPAAQKSATPDIRVIFCGLFAALGVTFHFRADFHRYAYRSGSWNQRPNPFRVSSPCYSPMYWSRNCPARPKRFQSLGWLHRSFQILGYGPTHRFGTVRRVNRWGEATAVAGYSARACLKSG